MSETVEDRRQIQQIVHDYSGANTEHGYTKLENSDIYYWVIDAGGLTFRGSEVPKPHIARQTRKWAREQFPDEDI